MENTDLDIAALIAKEILNETAILKRISGRGTCNEVFFAAAGAKKIIIRLNSDRDDTEFRKEEWSMVQAALAGASVPKSLAHGKQAGWNYSVQSFEGDTNGTDHADQLSIWRWLGEMAAKFHKVKVEGFGVTLIDEKSGRFDGDWQKYVVDNFESVAEGEFELTQSQAIGLRHRFQNLAVKKFDIGLCHGDLKPGNMVLDQERKTIIDWGCAHAHVVPHYDFFKLLRDHDSNAEEVKAFSDGYGITDQLDIILPEIESVLLLCHFDVWRWAIDRAPEKTEEKKKEFQSFLNRFQPS